MFDQTHDLIQKREDGLVFIRVNGGSRKPQIFNALLKEAQLQGFRVLVISGTHNQSSSYTLLRTVFGKLFGFTEGDSADSRQRKVIQFLEPDPDVQVFSPLYNDILDIQIPDAILTAHLPESEKGKLLNLLMLETFKIACLESPLVIVFDEVGELVSGSWKSIHQISDALDCLQYVFLLHSRHLEPEGNRVNAV